MEAMREFLIYNVKVAVCLAVFYLFYKLLLSRETFHRLNRAVIAGVIVLSFLLPVCRVTIYRQVPVAPVDELFRLADRSAAAVQPARFDWTMAAALVFISGAVVAVLRTAVSVGAVVRIIREGRHERLDSQAILVRLPREVAPFSWIRWIVVGERDLAANSDVIIAHERAHIRLHHSYDLLATDLLAMLQWFNPAMWLLRAELRAVHEYEADAAVLAGGADARAYQMLLIEKAVGERWCSVANSLNHSKLKNRITMMLRKKSSRWATARVLFVIPLVCIAAVAFARTVAVPVEDKVSENYSIAEIAPDNPQSKSDTVSIAVAGRQKKTAAAGKGNPVVVKLNSGDVGEVLFVVDGREANGIDDLDPENIESITVLKDKSAVERYGEKAKNGAVLITTKGAGMKILTIAGDSAPRVVYSGRVTYDDNADVALWIVDGREVAQEEGKAVNPDDIDHMTIYKGDEAVTRYGERARNGVIEIRTKRVATDHSKSQARSGVDKKMPQAR